METEDLIVSIMLNRSDSRVKSRSLVAKWSYLGKRIGIRFGGLAEQHHQIQLPLQAKSTVEIAWCDGAISVRQDGELALDRKPVSELMVAGPANGEAAYAQLQIESTSVALRRIRIARDIVLRSPNHAPMESVRYPRLADGELFVLGDNQPLSVDSRQLGLSTQRISLGSSK